jgi:hypothetical protein
VTPKEKNAFAVCGKKAVYYVDQIAIGLPVGFVLLKRKVK